MPRRNGRSLTEEEERMWRYVTRFDTKLHKQERLQNSMITTRKPSTPHIEIKRYRSAGAMQANANVIPPVVDAQLDSHTARRLQKGAYAIEGRLDLHGMTRDKAHQALIGFLERHHERASRCVLVITGKGSRGMEGESGILRRYLPHWLELPPLKSWARGCTQAARHDGGDGAFYILMRRQKDTHG